MKIFTKKDRERYKENIYWLDYLENEFELDYNLEIFKEWTLGLVVVTKMIAIENYRNRKKYDYIPDGAFITKFTQFLIKKFCKK